MEARSSNSMGRWVHFGGDLAAGVQDGIGFIYRSASTGSTGIFEPLSDSSTAALKIRAKGAAGLTLGNSSNTVSVVGSAITLTGAGSPIKGAYSTTFSYAISSGVVAGAQFEYNISTSVGDIMPGDLFSVEQGATTATIALVGIRSSTHSDSRVVVTMVNYSSTTLTTQALTGRVTWLDLT